MLHEGCGEKMDRAKAELHFLCGKIAAGKSTLSRSLAARHRAVILSEDDWLHILYSEELRTIPDYLRLSTRLKQAVAPHVLKLLSAGVTVILDFPANTVEQRRWMRALADSSAVPHTLHYLDVQDEVCKARLRRRNVAGDHNFKVTDAQFEQITRHFVAPTAEEGFNIVVHT
ncbi:AAA family ATPase [Ruegeria aquimaris]|uniref:ATP-binding protein n=1 Tax=Ruegeria aquimaris TaxID=2984333 RepID=A0ABT3AM57_9RHOB|nr:ATP-binding protein [Ruegeria sp. XHP0148]MCV2889770.1 ATP-binding protein [Ruegeria sp. XHP0148]